MSIPDGTYSVNYPGLSLTPLSKTEGFWVATGGAHIAPRSHSSDLICAVARLCYPDTLGIWTDPDTGKVYFDAPELVLNRDAAITLAQRHNQIAIWDCANNVSIPTGGTGEAA